MKREHYLAAMLIVAAIWVGGSIFSTPVAGQVNFKPRWEFTMRSYPDERLEEGMRELNTLGEQGWELAAVMRGGRTPQYFLKRQK